MINLIFQKNFPNVLIPCYITDKFSDIVEKYRMKTQDYDDNYYIKDGLNLNIDCSVAELGLNDRSIITVSNKLNVNGGILFAASFTDVSANKFQEINFSKDLKNVPVYRLVKKGINIFGICHCKKCSAHKKEVIARISQDKFDLIKDRDELCCPACGSIITPKTVGFFLCQFKISGKKFQNGLVYNFANLPDEAKNKDSFKYFVPENNGEATFMDLIFEVLKYY